jgi:PAS domain S-box-containing protein
VTSGKSHPSAKKVSTGLSARVEGRFGVLPNFFRLAPETPEITERLWGFAQAAYLDNPMPSVFKERLFVYLSRFCGVRYCIARHVGFLVGLGRPAGDAAVRPQSIVDVVNLLRRPFPREKELQLRLSRCMNCPAPLDEMPAPDSELEDVLFTLAGHVFLQTSDATACLDAMERLLGVALLQYMLLFLAFVRAAHYWTKVHPEIEFEADIKHLLATHEALAACILNDPEADSAPLSSVSQLLLQELPELRLRADKAIGLLAAIVDSSDDAIVSKNLDGVITSWNKSAERLFGYSPEEAIGQHISFIIPADRQDEEVMIIERIRRGDRIEHFDTIRVRKDGKQVDISVTISPVKDAAGRVIGASKVARDIRERRQVEQVLAERALLLDLSNDAILVRDGADRITYWNKGASELYGYNREEAVGRVTHELLHTEFPEPLSRINEQLHRHDRWSGELVHRRKDGTQIVVISRWVLNRDDRGNRKSVLETNNDITQQKQREKALRESENRLLALTDTLETQVRIRTEQLVRRNAEVLKQSEQLRDLSHRMMQVQDEERRHIARELHDSAGQLLTVLAMDLSTLVRNAQEKAPEIAESAEQARELVHQLSSEIRTTSYLLHPPLLDEEGLQAAISLYVRGLAERSGLDITLSISEGLGRLPRDTELAVFRLVQECLTNIHRHSGSKLAAIRLKCAERCVLLEVEDAGSGISPEKLLEIQSHGTGVGIRGMRERVLRCRGEMKVESEGRGTKISITLPVSTS